MSTDAVEREVQRTAANWAFVRRVETVDKTDVAIKIRLHIDTDCFIQVYANTRKQIISYAVVFNRARILGRDCDGGLWHRHPPGKPDNTISHPTVNAPYPWTNSSRKHSRFFKTKVSYNSHDQERPLTGDHPAALRFSNGVPASP